MLRAGAFESLPGLVQLLLDAAQAQGSAVLRRQLEHRNRRGETAEDIVSVFLLARELRGSMMPISCGFGAGG